MKAYLLAIIFVSITLVFSCKTVDENSGLRSNPESKNNECRLEKNWAGRMGMRLKDSPQGEGAVIDCVMIGEGLHHIGLSAGDTIIALNSGTKVSSANGFEQAARGLVTNSQNRMRRWEFLIQRSGKQLTVRPSDKYPGCGIFTFDDCGPLSQ